MSHPFEHFPLNSPMLGLLLRALCSTEFWSSSWPRSLLSSCYCCCCCLVTKLYLTHGDPMDCRPPGCSVHGISQARMLEWIAISFSKVFSRCGDWARVSYIGRWILYQRATWTTLCHLSHVQNHKISSRVPCPPVLLGDLWVLEIFFVFKLFIKFVTILFLSVIFFFFFGLEACGIWTPGPGIEPATPALEGKVLTTGPTGKSLGNLLDRHPALAYEKLPPS